MQGHGDQLRPVAFCSRIITGKGGVMPIMSAKFRKTATPVPLITQSRNRGLPVEDSLGDLFVIGTTFSLLPFQGLDLVHLF